MDQSYSQGDVDGLVFSDYDRDLSLDRVGPGTIDPPHGTSSLRKRGPRHERDGAVLRTSLSTTVSATSRIPTSAAPGSTLSRYPAGWCSRVVNLDTTSLALSETTTRVSVSLSRVIKSFDPAGSDLHWRLWCLKTWAPQHIAVGSEAEGSADVIMQCCAA